MPEQRPDHAAASSSTPRPRFGWHRVTRTLVVLGVALGCVVLLYLFAQRLPAFRSITRSAMWVVAAIALLYVARTWMPRHGQRRQGERRNHDDRRD